MLQLRLFPTQNPNLNLQNSLSLSCSLYLYQWRTLGSCWHRGPVHSPVPTLGAAVWCRCWRLTHNAVCCHRHSCLSESALGRSATSYLHSHFPSWYHTSSVSPDRCKPPSLLTCNECSFSPSDASLHMLEPSSHSLPFICNNSTYTTNLSLLLWLFEAGQASPQRTKVTLMPTALFVFSQ